MQSLPKISLLPFTEEHEAFRKEFGEFLDREIVPYYMDMEKNHSVGKETFKKFGDAGYGCLWLDKKYGGRELDMLYSIVYGEELNKRGLNGVLTRLSSDTVAPYIYAHGTEEQKAKYLPGVASGDTCICICMTEAEHGSDLAHIETSAVKDGKGNYIVNGGKIYISNGMVSDYAIVAVVTNPNAEKPHKGISLLIIPTDAPGFERKLLNKIGLNSQDTSEYIFHDVVVPEENLLGEENRGFYYLMQHLEKERLMGSWGTLGMAEYAFELCVQRANERLVAGKPLGAYQHWQFEIAKAAAELDQARSYVEHLTLLFMAGESVNTQVSIAKYATSELAYKISDLGVQIWGGPGILRENAIARQFVDTRHYRLMAGTSEVQLGIIAKAIGLGKKK